MAGEKMKLGNKKRGLPHQPYSFFGRCVPESCHNGKILNDTFRVDSFASTGFSAIGAKKVVTKLVQETEKLKFNTSNVVYERKKHPKKLRN